MPTALVVFTRDLRVRDNPALARAVATADHVIPLFVHDDNMPAATSGNRARFLRDALDDLNRSLQERGGYLLERQGAWTDTVLRTAAELGAGAIHLAADVSGYAQRRAAALSRDAGSRLAIHTHPGVTVVEPGAVTPPGSGSYRVFTAYYRKWLQVPRRKPLPPPERIVVPAGGKPGGATPGRPDLPSGTGSPDLIAGGESIALRQLRAWARTSLAGYPDHHDDLAGDETSRISAALHFGCLSPLEVATRLHARVGGAAFVRQLAWRDFFHQLLRDHPEASCTDLREGRIRWADVPEALEAWKSGTTGYPVVDAAMAQLTNEGFMPNRARMVVASFLTKDLQLDWRLGAAHFMEWLVDGDVANNQLNWQWVAGTGTDTNPHRIFNPVTQSRRFDPDGRYIRRHLPQLAHLDDRAIHWPDREQRRTAGYPEPIVDHREAVAAFRAMALR